MSRTEDERRQKEARWNGYLAGKYGDPIESNPHRCTGENAAWAAWRDGWEQGIRRADARRLSQKTNLLIKASFPAQNRPESTPVLYIRET